jgi:two-component system sensor histidine kinase RegB
MEYFSNNILLSNLIKIRWIAIGGQLCAVLLVFFYLKINFLIIACLCIIFLSVAINIYSFFINKINNHLSDKEAFYFLLFDTMQLGTLLFLTGGIYNPFSLLLIAPLIISASYLPIVYSIGLLFLSVCVVLVISSFYFPISWNENFNVPRFFTYGLTLSLIVSLIFLSIYVYLFANSSRRISQALLETRLALDNQKKLSEIGSLSAAAVHELSTPLNTIFLVLSDLRNEESVKKNYDLKKEIDLLKSQADRCRNILLTLSKNPENLKDSFLNKITISNLIKLNFDKFNNKKIKLKLNLISSQEEPLILFKDELLYGIGNIIQNAIQHAEFILIINIYWDNNYFVILVEDDGAGFKNEIFNQIGKPYIVKQGKGMGLGIFIAKNLFENIGGSISFKNKKEGGASVEIRIKRVI